MSCYTMADATTLNPTSIITEQDITTPLWEGFYNPILWGMKIV